MFNLLYVDPATVSVLLTSITGVAVAIGATFLILWRKFKKKASKILHIDENAGKEVEEDVVVTTEEFTQEEKEEKTEE